MVLAIQRYLAEESLDSSANLYNCLRCQSNTRAKIKTKIIKMPRFLIIQVKRFENQLKKVTDPIEYPLEFDMDEVCNKPWKELGKFSLVGLICHKDSKSINKGHYVAIVKRYEGMYEERKSK